MAITRLGPNQSINLASNITGTLPVGNGGTGATSFAPGKVLQVVQGNTATQVAHSTSYADTGLTASITPSSTSNKILIMVDQHLFTQGDSGGSIKLLRDTTSIYAPPVTYAFYIDGASADPRNYHSFSFLDTPSSTNSLAYKTQGIAYNSTAFQTQNNSIKSFITLMEVAG